MKYIAQVRELKNKTIRVRGAVLSSIELWDALLVSKGYKRIDDVHSRGIFSLFFTYPYEVHYQKQ